MIQGKKIAHFLAVFFVSSLHAGEDNPDLMQQEIKHVVVFMMENRSFDNILGWLYSKEAPLHFIPSASTLPFQGLSEEMLNEHTNILRDSSGNIVYSSPPIHGVPSVSESKLINSPAYNPHEPFDHVTAQIFGSQGEPSMLGFLQDYASLWDEKDWMENKQNICAVMETYTARELPVLHHLARHYAISDLWFASVPTQTNPNRAFLVCGTSEGQIVNGPFGRSTFTADTIWNRLSEETPDATWSIFWQTDTIPVIFPGPFNSSSMFKAMDRIPHIDQHYERLDSFHELARKGELPNFSFIEPQWTLCDEIELDQNDPNLRFLVGIQGNDLHPPGDVRNAENLLANVYTSLISNKEAWNNTLFIVLFDEHGGIFDHISPPASLAPDDHFENGFTFNRYGVRTPALFISPLIKKGTIIRSDSAVPFDHTSFIATLFKWLNIDQSKWNMGKRVEVAPTFEGVITESVPRNDPIIAASNLAIDEAHTLTMGDVITLKDPNGNYLTVNGIDHHAKTGPLNQCVPLQFYPNAGKITHGSFALIKWSGPSLSDEYFLNSNSARGHCFYTKNHHSPGQWWTIKSVDNPYLGYEIKNGDRIYLESHLYLKVFNYVPNRLATSSSFFWGESVTIKPITDESADECYWIIEKQEI